MSEKLFGTDGIRGEFGTYPLIEEIVVKIALFAGTILSKKGGKLLLGNDTRESCQKIKEWLVKGFSKAGLKSYDCGVFPTPGISAMVKTMEFDFGVVVSASHNPYNDNGIKFFFKNGEKLPDEVEESIEKEIIYSKENILRDETLNYEEIDLKEDYLNVLLKNYKGLELKGKRILLDTANGASYKLAPALFSKLNANVITINNSPDGKNINDNCGSLFAHSLKERAEDCSYDYAFSFDGDADRCILVLPSGEVLDGDYLLYNEAIRRKKENKLAENLVVGTVMSNFGLESALKREGVSFLRAKVGDRYVLDLLKKVGGEIGGEPSGHIIMLDKSSTGDGLLTALTYSSLIEEKIRAENLKNGLEMCHQKIVNLKVKERRNLDEMEEVKTLLEELNKKIGDNGRVVLRYSGTELLLRVMVEAKDKKLMEEILNSAVSKLKEIFREE